MTQHFAKRKLLASCLGILGFICMLNLNGVVVMATGLSALTSAAIVVFCLAILLKSGVPVWVGLGSAGRAFASFSAIFLAIALVQKFDQSLLISHLGSILIVFAVTIGTRALYPNIPPRSSMLAVAIIASIGAYSVFLSPWLGSLYANTENAAAQGRVGRYLGFFANPNESGFACVMALAPLLAVFTFPGAKRPYLIILAILATAAALILTFSRSAILIYVAVAATYFVYCSNNRRVFPALTLAAFASVIAISLIWSGALENVGMKREQVKRLQSLANIFSGKVSQEDTGGRLNGIRGGLVYYSESPIVGHGLGSMRSMPYRFFRGLGCHNTYITVLGEAGPIAAIAFAWFALQCLALTRLIASTPVRFFVIAYLVCFFGNCLVSHTILNSRNHNYMFGVCLGILAAHEAHQRLPRVAAKIAARTQSFTS